MLDLDFILLQLLVRVCVRTYVQLLACEVSFVADSQVAATEQKLLIVIETNKSKWPTCLCLLWTSIRW
jgi:hypothetical protein